MWQQFAKGNIEKKILPGSDLHNVYSRHEYDSNLSESSHSYGDYDGYGRCYVNTGLNEYEKENEEYNEVLLSFSLFLLLYYTTYLDTC